MDPIVQPRQGDPLVPDDRRPLFQSREDSEVPFNAKRLQPWRHQFQNNDKIQLWTVFGYFCRNEKLLNNFLGIRDLLAIQGRGHDFYRHFLHPRFRGMRLFGLKSFSETNYGLAVPYITERKGEVVLEWARGNEVLTEKDVAPWCLK